MSADCSKCGCDLTLDENFNYICHYCKQEKEIEQLKARLLSFEQRYTCFNCLHGKSCKFAFDEYNTNGDCIAGK